MNTYSILYRYSYTYSQNRDFGTHIFLARCSFSILFIYLCTISMSAKEKFIDL